MLYPMQVLLGDALFREREHRRAIVRALIIEYLLGISYFKLLVLLVWILYLLLGVLGKLIQYQA